MRTIRIVALAAWLVAVNATVGSAQTRAVLVHGIFSSGLTWETFWGQVLGDGFDAPPPPSLSSIENWRTQAGQLLDYKNVFQVGTSALLVGHSQGGLVSRLSTMVTEGRSEPAFAVITVGSPHLGAPIAAAADAARAKVFRLFVLTTAARVILDQLEHDLQPGTDLWSLVTWANIYLSDVDFRYQEAGGAAVLTVLPFVAGGALNDLSGQSGMLSYMNDNYEAEQTTQRRSILSDLGFKGYVGGPLRLFMPADSADAKGWAIESSAIMTYFSALGLMFSPDAWDSGYMLPIAIGAGAAMDAGWEIAMLSSWWSDEVVGGAPNDGVVPTANQIMPGSTAIAHIFDCAHSSEETNKLECRAEILSQMRAARTALQGQ